MSIAALSGMTLDWPWLLALLPLPWLLRRLLSPLQQTQAAARVPFAAEFDGLSAGIARGGAEKRGFKQWLWLLCWLLLVLAAARPVWYGDAVALPVSGRDLMLAVDISGSMQTEDFEIGGRAVDRLTATKQVAGVFIGQRQGDRIGLILFGSNAYVQTPLTFDRKTVVTLLNEAVIGLAGKATAIGDAIGLTVKRLESANGGDHVDAGEQVLILLTDGVNTAGELSPDEASELAKSHGLKIYTIGIGADAMTVQSFFGSRQVNPSAELDEKGLTAIAEATGGHYFRAHDSHELKQIYTMIDQLEPVARDQVTFRPRHSLFVWPLAAAMLLASLLMIGMIDRRRLWKD